MIIDLLVGFGVTFLFLVLIFGITLLIGKIAKKVSRYE